MEGGLRVHWDEPDYYLDNEMKLRSIKLKSDIEEMLEDWRGLMVWAMTQQGRTPSEAKSVRDLSRKFIAKSTGWKG